MPAPASTSVEGAGPSGTPTASPAIVDLLTGATASDLVDGTVAVINDAPSQFPLGSTLVTFSATDVANNTGTATATVTGLTGSPVTFTAGPP